VLRVVLYAEDTAQVRRIAHQVEEDPSCELIALCATPADLNFVLDRVTVDVLLLRLTPETGDGVLSAAWERTRHVHLLLRVQSGARRQFRVPNDLLLEDLELQSVRSRVEGEFWALLSPMPQLGAACRTAKDIMGAEAYGRLDGREWSGDDSRCNTLA
jgi:hypothetical protein